MSDPFQPEPDSTDPAKTGAPFNGPVPQEIPDQRKSQKYPELNAQGVWEGTTPKEPVE